MTSDDAESLKFRVFKSRWAPSQENLSWTRARLSLHSGFPCLLYYKDKS